MGEVNFLDLVKLNNPYFQPSDFIPDISSYDRSYGIGGKVPWFYFLLAPLIHGSERWQKKLTGQTADLVSRHEFSWVNYLRIDLTPWGVYIEVTGENGCSVYINYQATHGDVHCHNVDAYSQAHLLHLTLSVYLKNFYEAVEVFCDQTAVDWLAAKPDAPNINLGAAGLKKFYTDCPLSARGENPLLPLTENLSYKIKLHEKIIKKIGALKSYFRDPNTEDMFGDEDLRIVVGNRSYIDEPPEVGTVLYLVEKRLGDSLDKEIIKEKISE